MKSIATALFFLVCMSVAAAARPSPYPPPDQFAGDRYAGRMAQGANARDVTRFVQSQRKAKKHRRHYRKPAPGYVAHAPGRPAAWCGWWLGQHLGIPFRNLWLARNWASVGSNAGGPQIGTIVVWRHHVGIITGHGAKGWIVKSGNDGRRVRERPRSLAGAIAFRRV